MASRVQLEAVLKLIDVDIDPRVFTKISRATAGLPATFQQTGRAVKGATGNLDQFASSATRTGRLLDGNAQAARLFLQRMTQFAILLPTFVTLNRAIQGSAKFMAELETEVRRIIALNIDELGDKFDKIADAAFEIGREFRISALEAAKSIKLFTQAGFSLSQAQDLARTSALAAKVSTLEVASAQELAIAITKQFGDQVTNLNEAFDKIIKVEDIAAVGAQDIADAFVTGGNALAFATKSFEDTIGLISALREQTRKSGREVGTFFKTLGTRITAAGEAQTAVKALGIEVTNLDGTLRPLANILVDVSKAFEGMTEAQVANASKAIAGVRQFESFIATIKSVQRATSIAATASDALGTAQEKNRVIAESLSERLQALRVAGQGVARALAEAGTTEAFKGAVKFAEVFLNGLELIIKTVDRLGASLTPLLAALASASTAAVLGFGGGFRQTLRGGRPGPGAAGPASTRGFAPGVEALDAAAAKAAGSITSMQTVTARLQQQTIIQTSQGKQLIDVRARNIAVIQQATQAQQGFVATMRGGAIATSRKFSAALNNVGGRIAIFTAGSILAGSALDKLRKSIDETEGTSQRFSANFLDITKNAAQTGLQFALLNPTLGGVIAGLTALTTILSKYSDAVKENQAANQELAKLEFARAQQLEVSQSDIFGGFTGEQIADVFRKGIRGRTGGQIDFTRLIDTAFQGLEQSAQKFIGSAKDLREVLFNPELGEPVIQQLSTLDDSLFENADALMQLRDSFDQNGNAVVSHSQLLDLLFRAFGKVDVAVNETTKQIDDFIFSWEDFQRRFKTQELIQEMQFLNQSITDAAQPIDQTAQGIDKLRLNADRSQQAFEIAQKNFDILRDKLINLVGVEVFPDDLEQATKLFEDLTKAAKLTPGAESTEVVNKLLRGLGEEQAQFARQFVDAERSRLQAQKDLADAELTVRQESFDRNKQLLDNEKEASLAAQEALDEFNIALLEFGGDAQKAIANIGEFIDLTDVQKAQRALANVSEIAAIKAETLGMKITDLDTAIEALSGAAEGSEGAFKRAELTQKRSSLQLQVENVEREKTLNTIKASVALAEAERKALEDAKDAEEKRLKVLQKLADAEDDFAKTLREINEAFEEFVLDKLADLASREADALQNLKDAQQDVLDSTKELANAQEELVNAIFEFNGVLAQAQIQVNLIERDIRTLTGGISSFQDRLASLDSAFREVLDESIISLEKRIELERQLAQETLNFLQEARNEITQAGLSVFGQSATENQALREGIAALNFIVDQLGGSFENFLNLSDQELASVSQQLLNLPLTLRESILSALQALPGTVSIGGFSVDQLRDALGQVGAGVAPEVGLPSLEELTTQQVEQLRILQDLAIKDAQLQFGQVQAARDQVELAKEQLDAAKILEERAREEFQLTRDEIAQEIAVLEAANVERQELLARVVEADDRNTLRQIEKEAQLFAEQNFVFRDVGQQIVQGVASAINARVALIEASATATGAHGLIPNLAGGNLTPREAAGLLRAASAEKKAMPPGAGLAVANTSEAIIPMRNRGFIPHFQEGLSPIAAGIDAIRQINETVVAAIARSVTQALADLQAGGGQNTDEILERIVAAVNDVQSELSEISESNTAIQSNTATTTTDGGATAPAATTGQDVNITLQTNQNNVVQVTGLDSLITQIREAVRDTTLNQVDQQLEPLLEELEAIFQTLRERGLITGFNQSL